MRNERIMMKRTYSSSAAKLAVSAAALIFASCGIEAAEQVEAKTPAEQIAERFAETASGPDNPSPAQAQIDAARQKSEDARNASEQAKKVAAAKRTEEKARRQAAAAAAAKAAEQAKADEAEMLAQARAEAEQRRAEMEQARIEREQADVAAIAAEKAKVDAELAQQRLAAVRRAAEQAAAEAARVAQAQRQADEIRAAEARRLAEEKLISEAQAQAAEARRQAEARALAEAKAHAEEQERIAEAQRMADLKVLEARREVEAKALAEKLRAVEAAREAKAAAIAEAARQVAAPPRAVSPGLKPAGATDTVVGFATPGDADQLVAVLLIMEPGNKGIRRFDKSADPILCVREGCYISEGADRSARLLSRARALGIGNTWGRRAGACQHSLGCVFREVDLISNGGVVQPVDMKIMVHDRREPQTLNSDSDCRLAAGRLSCRRPVTANGYRMWVIPEALARQAGGAALEAAVHEGLPQSTSAGLAQ